MKYNECNNMNNRTGQVINGRPNTKIVQGNFGPLVDHPDPRLDMSTHRQQPLCVKHSVPITIKRFFTDVNGTIIAKGLMPAALQVPYPFFTLGYFDLMGGFAAGLKAVPVTPGTFYLLSFIEGNGLTSQQITGFSGVNNIKAQIRTGDIVHVYTDDLDAPNRFIWLVQSSRNGALGSIICNTGSCQNDNKIGPMGVEHIQYFTNNPDPQWQQTLHFIRSSNIGSIADNQVNPYTFKTPTTEQDGFVRVRTSMLSLNQYQSIGTYFLYDTDEIQFNFLITE